MLEQGQLGVLSGANGRRRQMTSDEGLIYRANASLAQRVAAYLADAHPLLGAQRVAARPTIGVAQLEGALDHIGPRIRSARSAGAFMNVWTAAGLGRNEIRNAAVLAWLLDPRGTHGLNDLVARAVLGNLRRPPAWLVGTTSFEDMSVVTEERPLGSRENRVDISMMGSGFLIFIEVKIDAPEGERQMERYLEEMELKAVSHGARHTAVVYLTSRGEAPAGTPTCPSLAWRDVEQGVGTVARSLPLGDIRRAMLIQFAGHIHSF